MLDDTIKTQLKAYLERLQRPIELVASICGNARHARRDRRIVRTGGRTP